MNKQAMLTMIKRVMRSDNKKYKPVLGKANPFCLNSKNYFGFTQGYYVLASGDNFGYDIATENERIKLEEFFKFDLLDTQRVRIDITELKAHCEETKRKNPEPYIIDNKVLKIGLNPFYLLDVLTFNSTDCISMSIKSPFDPVITMNDEKNTLGLLLPIRLHDKLE
jgi:hypothetical protein